MNSNYMFAINRRQMGTGPAAGTSPAAPAPRSLAPAPSGDRFSINRLINYKSAGGCRSCN